MQKDVERRRRKEAIKRKAKRRRRQRRIREIKEMARDAKKIIKDEMRREWRGLLRTAYNHPILLALPIILVLLALLVDMTHLQKRLREMEAAMTMQGITEEALKEDPEIYNVTDQPYIDMLRKMQEQDEGEKVCRK